MGADAGNTTTAGAAGVVGTGTRPAARLLRWGMWIASLPMEPGGSATSAGVGGTELFGMVLPLFLLVPQTKEKISCLAFHRPSGYIVEQRDVNDGS